MGRISVLTATAAIILMAAVGTCNAQKKKDKDTTPSPAADPNVITVNGCVEKGSDGVFTLTKAQRESGAANSSDTWVFDIAPLAAGVIDLDDRVGQRVQATGRIEPPPSADATSKPAGKPTPPQLIVRSVKPVEGKPCS